MQLVLEIKTLHCLFSEKHACINALIAVNLLNIVATYNHSIKLLCFHFVCRKLHDTCVIVYAFRPTFSTTVYRYSYYQITTVP